MKKLCARWLPCLLTADQKHIRNSAWSVLTRIKLILCINLLLWMKLGFTITHQNRNSSQNSGQKPVVQCQRRQGHSRSWHLFWNAEGILFDYHGKSKTITGEYYYNLLTRLGDEKICEKRPGFQKKKKNLSS
jgi:hypothetical protein